MDTCKCCGAPVIGNDPVYQPPMVTMGEIWEACRSENGMINLKEADRVADLLRSRGVEVAE